MKKRFETLPATLVIALALCLAVAAGCSNGQKSEGDSDTVTIGSKKFSEQYIIAEMMGQLIEAKTDMKANLKTSLGGTMICHGAITNGEIDLYAEYTGTGLVAILQHDVINDPEKAYDTVKEEYAKQFGVTWLKPFGVNNAYTITVRKSDAEKYGWKSVSDLAVMAGELRAGFEPEFIERPDGFAGLKDVYGLKFKSINEMDPGLMYKAIANKEVDVICGFATDGRIPAYELKVLEDDRHFFPPYYAAPIIRSAMLKEHPELENVLNVLAGKLDNETMQKLNYEADEKQRDPKDIAREFLKTQKLID